MIPVPTRRISCRLTTTYAGFEGESELLEALNKRGLAQPLVGPDLYAGDGLLAAPHIYYAFPGPCTRRADGRTDRSWEDVD